MKVNRKYFLLLIDPWHSCVTAFVFSVFAVIVVDLDKFNGFDLRGSLENSSLFDDGNMVFPKTIFNSSKGRLKKEIAFKNESLTKNPTGCRNERTKQKKERMNE